MCSSIWIILDLRLVFMGYLGKPPDHARIIQISTDAVFDGKVGNYVESDTPNPLSVYAATKLGGEKAVLSANLTRWYCA